MKEIYLDSAAMSHLLSCAWDAFHRVPFGNPSSEHAVGQRARDALESAREKIAALMDCEPEEIIFTSTATEAAALAWYSVFKAKQYCAIESDKEHHAISENARAYDFPYGKQYAVASMLANNETGEILQVPSVAHMKLWLCDATAAVGHIPVSFKTLGCDYLIADGIKFGGVPGAAFLIAKNGAPITPLIRGGGQERGMRSGTENLPAICAMADALEWQTQHTEENTAKLSKLSEIMRTELSKIDGHLWNTDFDKPHLPNIMNISFPGIDAHTLALFLSKEGIMVSPGAACSNGLHEPSHVILAMFGDEDRARSAIRISFSIENELSDVMYAAAKIEEAVKYLRQIS